MRATDEPGGSHHGACGCHTAGTLHGGEAADREKDMVGGRTLRLRTGWHVDAHRHNEQRLRVRPRFLGGRSSGARYDTPRELVLVGHLCIRMPADAGRYGPGARTAERGAQELTRSSKLLTA